LVIGLGTLRRAEAVSYPRVLLASGVLAASESEFHAETRTTTGERGELLSGSRSMHRAVVRVSA